MNSPTAKRLKAQGLQDETKLRVLFMALFTTYLLVCTHRMNISYSQVNVKGGEVIPRPAIAGQAGQASDASRPKAKRRLPKSRDAAFHNEASAR